MYGYTHVLSFLREFESGTNDIYDSENHVFEIDIDGPHTATRMH